MDQLFFWNSWQKPYKQIYWGLLALLFGSIVFFFVGWISGIDIAFPWETFAQAETVSVVIDTIKVGPFQLPLEVQNYLLTESFQGGDLALYKWPSYLMVAILAMVFTLAITCITALQRFWYLVGMGLVITFLMSLQLESLQLFGTINKIALVIFFIAYLPLSYYYQSINSGILFSTRLLFFSLITTVLGLLIYFGSSVDYPFLQFAAHAYVAPVILSILFILMIGHQILTGFIYLITKNNNAYSKNSLSHFLIISAIYLVNLFIVVLNEIQVLYWELFNFHPFVLLLISTLIGILLYSYREETYKHIYQFYPIGGFVYLMLAVICFFTIGYHLFSANDAVIEVLQDFILYAHFGYGFIFFIYILANFLNPLSTNKQAYKVLYNPQHMPYFTYRFAGTIAVTAFILFSNYQIPLFYATSGYYNVIGDMHYQLNEEEIAEVYYRKAAMYDYRGHHAHYALGTMSRNQQDIPQAAYHFNEAIHKRPSPQTFINLGNIYLEEGKFFDGLFTIRDGLEEFPDNDRIQINLGLQYEKAAEVDSAFLIFNGARDKSLTEKSANVNIIALLNKGDYDLDVDSIISEYNVENHEAFRANVFALKTANHEHWPIDFAPDSLLNLVTGNTLYNQLINQFFGEDSSYLSQLEPIALISRNNHYKERLQFAQAIGFYYHQEVEKAFRQLDILANYHSETKGYYYYVLGLLSLDQESPMLAVDFLRKSQQSSYPKADLALAVATTEAGLIHEAILFWQELILNPDPTTRQIAELALKILQRTEMPLLSDSDRYWYWRYQINKENFIDNFEVLDQMKDTYSKTRVHQDLLDYHLSMSDTVAFMNAFSKAIDTGDPDQWTWYAFVKADLKEELKEIEIKDQSSISMSDRAKLHYYQARAAQAQGDTATATRLFDKTSANPFFETGVIGKANYLNSTGKQMEAYNILLNALEINPYAVNLRKQYILQCADMDFERYAEYALEDLRPLVSGQDYLAFKEQYENRLSIAKEDVEYFEEE